MNPVLDVLDTLPIDLSAVRRLPLPGLRGNCLLELDLARGLAETAPTSPIEALRRRNVPTVHQVVEGLRVASQDARVRGLVVHACASGLPPAHAEEVRAAVERFADSDRPVVAWAETYGEFADGVAGYLVATAADEVWLQPSGYLQITGAVAEAVFLRDALDRVGVEPQFGARHEYKTAAQTFTDREISEPNREMLQSLTDSAVTTFLTGIARGRGLEADDLRSLLDEGPVTPSRARELRLVDRVGYRDEAYASARARAGVSDDVELRYVERYDTSPSPVAAVRERKRPHVAVVEAAGPIHLGRSGSSPMGGRSIGSDSLTAALRQASTDDAVGAIVLRVDSPGGSAVASDAVRREVLRVKARKPVVASMGAVAGSGGYFISMPCTEIVADATTLTGSIGVLAGKFVTQGGLDRVGVHRAQVSTGRYAGMLSSQRRFDEDEWAVLSRLLDEIYADFTTKAAHDRDIPVEELEPLARGRVWSGAQAAERGLVDHVGGLETAVERACALAGLDRQNTTTRVSPKIGLVERFMPADSSDSPVGLTTLGEGVPLLDRALEMIGAPAARPAGVLTMTPVRWA